MKHFLLIFLLSFTAASGISKQVTINTDLDGTWIPVKQEIAGTTLPPVIFEKQKLVIEDSLYTVVAESVDKGVVRYEGGRMDVYGKNGVNAGKHFKAIYKLEGGELTICYDLTGQGYPLNFDTKGMSSYFLSIYKKQENR